MITLIKRLFAKKPVKPVPFRIATVHADCYERTGNVELVTVAVFNGSYRASRMIATVSFVDGVAQDVALSDGIVTDSKWRDDVIAFAEDILPKLRK